MGKVDQDERRTRDRVETDIGIMCRIPALPGSARILDLSHRGCKLELGKRVGAAIGATILLDMPDGEHVSGQIVWVEKNVVGVRFSRSLSGATAVLLGIENAPEVQVVLSPAAEPVKTGLLNHWFRRVSKIF